MLRGCILIGLSLALSAWAALAHAAPPAQSPEIERKPVTVAPRTTLYCEDSTHAIQPMVYGDFGDLVGAYQRLEHWPGQVVTNGERADGEAYDVLMFTAPADDPKSPNEVVGYVITQHADGYALRAAYDQPQGLPAQKITGNDMCSLVLKMLVDSDPERAAAFRARWREQHPDSTPR